MQESKYKRINTKSLFGEFKSGIENLELTEEGLRLNRRGLYNPSDDILSEPDLEMIDVDFDECDIIYVLDRKNTSILTCHRDFEKIRFPAYESEALASVFENSEGIAVNENSVYIIGTLRIPEGEKKEALVAFGKKDLKVLWIIVKGPGGLSLKNITDLDMDSNGNLYILEKGRCRVLRLSLSRRERSFTEMAIGELLEPENIYIDPEGKLHVFDAKTGYFIYGTDGTVEKKEITSSIQGIANRRRAHDSKNNMYLIVDKGRRLRFFEYVEEYSPDPEGVFKGTYLSKPIDSQVQKTQWYRFILEGSFPKGTKVEFQYYISDELRDEKELRELSESEWEEGLPGSSFVQGEKERDALFRTKRKGRYLWFRITLVGTEKLSPEVSAVTIFFPKFSYLEYLPSVYSENPANRDFLDRFLAIFESLFFEIDYRIDHLDRLFDAEGTPPEFLEWLASWVAADQEIGGNILRKKIPEKKKREFISKAVSIYKVRGTRQGLEDLIFFYTGKKPTIIENLPADCIKRISASESRNGDKSYENQKEDYLNNGSPGKVGNPEQKKFLFFPPDEARVKLPDERGFVRKEVSLYDTLFGGENFSFVVLFEEKLEEKELELIRNIVEEEKPAYTTYRIKVLEPWFYLDGHTYLGKNTRLRRPEFLLGKYSVLGRDTALGAEKNLMLPDKDENHNHSIGQDYFQ
jgi:phage tail-like protein